LHERYGAGSSSERTTRLFATHMYNANEWRKIKIRRGSAVTRWGSSTTYHYLLEINKQSPLQTQEDLESGNEIRVKTAVKSLWTSECDPREYTPPQTTKATQPPSEPTTPPQTTKATQPPPEPTSSTQPPSPSLQPRVTATTITVDTSTQSPSTTITVDTKTMIIAAVSLVLILLAILMTVILVLRHRRRKRVQADQALTQFSDPQNRISRHVSENSLYGSYNNQGTGENQVPQDTSATNSANQRRGSAHDSENSLYGGIN
ncbi:unnamed protein product, partial [Meganyctiphanes norvegica]